MDYLAVTPRGDIYPVTSLDKKVSFIWECCRGFTDSDIRARFQGNHLRVRNNVNNAVRNFVVGAAALIITFSNGDIAIPAEISCTLHKKRIEGAIYRQIQKNGQEYQKNIGN